MIENIMGAFDDESPTRRQVNLSLEPAFYDKIRDAIAVLKIKRKPSQVIAEITEEFFEIWLASEQAKRQKLEEMKQSSGRSGDKKTRTGYRTIDVEKPRKK